jgi:CheY-like chemotaxis protein
MWRRSRIAAIMEFTSLTAHSAERLEPVLATCFAAIEGRLAASLLSDIAMPIQDGYDLIHQVRKSGRLARDLPAVALTAFAHKDDIRQALLAGFQMHIAKPIDPYYLIAVVASIAGRTGI